MGAIGKEKGRGERKAQMHFLTRARRSTKSNNSHAMTFVAYVQGVDAASATGVTAAATLGGIEAQQYHITVTRRGITDETEKATLQLSKDTQHCARLLVDKAAAFASVSPWWARKVTMHTVYERALSSSSCDNDDDDEEDDQQPEKAPVKFLLDSIGTLDNDDKASEVVALLGSAPQADVSDDQIHDFCVRLLALCREEKQRRSKPVAFSETFALGGPKTALNSSKTNSLSHNTLDTSHLVATFQSASSIQPPKGCEDATITVKGNGKFIVATTASPDNETQAREYLGSVSSSLQDAWLQTAYSTAPTEASKTKASSSNRSPSSDLQPSLSIGVIGDVANGKSTLVKAISGKRTQCHSSEQQQHGITIRLGFANASVLQCQNPQAGVCGSYSFLPEAQDTGKDEDLPTCPNCGNGTAVVRRFSLVDCPGHAELMATMLAGASAFDAVLLAAASNVPCPTPQARQHLEAIKLSGILQENAGAIAIAQTKAELLADESKNALSRLSPEERLEHHAQQGRDNLRRDVAGKAPIFPVCAPLGLGLEALAEWIANLPCNGEDSKRYDVTSSFPAPCLSVLRSFDVNRPGLPAAELSGGVLGGTIQGSGSIALGDTLEVRPGLALPSNKKASKKSKKAAAATTEPDKRSPWLKEDNKGNKKKKKTSVVTVDEPISFRVQPLRFQCTSLMTGKNQLSSVTKGGLVAVGTSLDPFVCADNRMVGSLVGHVGTLPPVWGPTLYLEQLRFVDLLPESGIKESSAPGVPSDLLKKGAETRLHIGSAMVKAKVIRVSKSAEKVEVCIENPVCAARGANVAFEGKDSRNNSFVLVAHAKLVDCDVCLEGAETLEEKREDKEGEESRKELETDDEDGASTTQTDWEELAERDELHRKRFLDDLEESNKEGSDSGGGVGSRLTVPHADIARDGGAHVVLSNFGVIAHSLRRDPAHLVMFLQKEGGLSCVLAGDRTSPANTTLRVRWRGGRNFAERFISILKKYIRAYVTCNQCRGAVTELLGTGKTEHLCRRCNARRFVTKL